MSKFGALRIGRRNPEQQESRVRVVGIWRDVTRDRRQGCFWPMLQQPCLALGDPLQNLALGHALACQGILIDPVLKRFLHRRFSRDAMTGYGEGLFHNDIEYGGLRSAGPDWAPPGAAATFAEPTAVRLLLAHVPAPQDAAPALSSSTIVRSPHRPKPDR